MGGPVRRCFLIAAAMLIVGSIDAGALETISGTITSAATLQLLGGIDIDVFDSTGASSTISGGTSAADGTYTVTLPGPDTYIVRADPAASDGVATQYYDGVFLRSQAQSIVVNSGGAISGVDFALVGGVTISGTVRSGGMGLGGIDIDIFALTGENLGSYNAVTAGDGSYTLGALPPGDYLLRADPDPALNQYYVSTYYGDQSDPALATPITVGSADVTGIDITVPAGGTISGTVTSAGSPLSGIDLDVYDSLGVRVQVNATTDALGHYEIGPMVPGGYIVRVDPTIAQGYPLTYYPAVYSEAEASLIQVNSGGPIAGIDFSLAPGGTISGSIYDGTSFVPLANVDLDCYDSTGRRMAATAKSDAGGAYVIGPLPAGTLYLRSDPGIGSWYAAQFYLGQIDIHFADAITVTAGQDTPNVDFGLLVGGSIEGTVRDGSAIALGNIDLDLFDAITGTRLRIGTTTLADGTYSIAGLAPGNYVLRCDPALDQGYAMSYYNGKLTKSTADILTVTSAGVLAGVDFVLGPGGSISGRVTDGENLRSVGNIDMDVLDAVTLLPLDQDALTDADGQYTLAGLPPGAYVVRADPSANQFYQRMYYGGTSTAVTATSVPLAAGENVTGIDIAFIPGLPALSATGLGMLVGAAALAAALVIRRKKYYNARRGKSGSIVTLH